MTNSQRNARDIEFFDQLPPELKTLMHNAPNNFEARFAVELLKVYSLKTVVEMLQDAIQSQNRDGKMAPLDQYTPVQARPRRKTIYG
jgi:hypothetical protein